MREIDADLAAIARDVQSGDGVGEAVDRICKAAVSLLGGGVEAGVNVAHDGRTIEHLGGTSEVSRRGDELQTALGEGPCVDATFLDRQVVTNNLATDDRWLKWGPQMVHELGVGSMLCTQLWTHEKQLGALNIYATEPDAFDEEAQEVAQLLAVHAATTVAAAQQVEGLRFANDRRATIGTAVGVVMAQYGLTAERAFEVLQRLSSQEERKLFDVAQQVIASIEAR